MIVITTKGTDETWHSGFAALIRAGFKLEAQMGCTVKELLCEQLALPEDYYEERIQTLFLNHKPVDDPRTALIKDGDTLALSAAMPGLVGATFRKGGHYSWMRGSISHSGNSDAADKARGWITVKLFNLILKELAPYFLKTGVWLEGATVQTFFRSLSDTQVSNIRSVSWNNREVELKAITKLALPDEWTFTKVMTAG